jgi:polyisoprenyl-phosphate glycosyltransferase
MAHISVISPVYNAAVIIPELVERITSSVKKITEDYEIILVEDGGADNSWEVIEDIAKANPHVLGIKLSRNFGQHYAITAGLDHANGVWVVVMDCDLQDKPEEINNLYIKAIEGYDIVLARRFKRKDTFFKRFFSKMFYRTLGFLTGSKQDENVANFGIYHKNVIDSVKSMRESIRYFPTMVKWVGFRTTKIEVTHEQRSAGKTTYNFGKLLDLALDIILAYSDKPIRIMIKTGLSISFLSLVIAGIYFIRWVNGDMIVLGYTSLIISVWLLSGIIIATLGVLGLYVGKTFEGVKRRPIYIIEKSTND